MTATGTAGGWDAAVCPLQIQIQIQTRELEMQSGDYNDEDGDGRATNEQLVSF